MSRLLGLGIDAGGTKTRWALAGADGAIVAEGVGSGMTGVQLLSDQGQAGLKNTLGELGRDVLNAGQPAAVCGGFTGLDQRSPVLADMIGQACGVTAAAVELKSDIEIAYCDVFAPGEGIVIYAGTGSVAAHVDSRGVLHRAGGRGVMLDDAGGGFWIAQQALRRIWRDEDERPGAWRDSAMAREVFDAIGGHEWGVTRAFFYGKERGEIGQLARAVAKAAETDPFARELMHAAGSELARLGRAMLTRFGPRPIALCGRAFLLHPAIERALRDNLAGSDIRMAVAASHHAAARIAARMATGRTASSTGGSLL
jgi:glucosamine kinase